MQNATMEVPNINGTSANYSMPANGTSLIDTSNFIIQGMLLTVVAVLGICGNFASIIYFSRPKRYRSHFEPFMLWLAVYDTIFILSAWLAYAAPVLSEYYVKAGYSGHLIPWVVPIAQTATTGTIYLTIAISSERYFMICHPFYHHGKHKDIPAKAYIIPIFIFAMLYNLSKFFELETIYVGSRLEGKLD